MKKILLGSILLLGLFFTGCNGDKEKAPKKEEIKIVESQKKEEVKTEENQEFTGRLIQKIEYSPEKEEIVIIFYEKQKMDNFNQNEVITITSKDPEDAKVKGTFRWADENTLVYKVKNYTPNSRYDVSFDVGKYLNAKYTPLNFTVTFKKIKIYDAKVSIKKKSMTSKTSDYTIDWEHESCDTKDENEMKNRLSRK